VSKTDAKEQAFLKRLRATFRTEAEEHLRALSAGLIELEKTTEPARRAEAVEGIFREAHSLKGAARSVNLKHVGSICQPLESTFAALKRQEIPLSPALFDLLHQAVDAIAQLVSDMDAEPTSADLARLRELSRRLAQAAQGGEPGQAQSLAAPGVRPAFPATALRALGGVAGVAETPVAEAGPQAAQPATFAPRAKVAESPHLCAGAESPHLCAGAEPVTPRSAVKAMLAQAETVRIPITKLDPLLLQAEEMIQAKLASGQRTADLREIQQALVSWKTESAKWKDQHTAQPSGCASVHPGTPFLAGNELPEWAEARLDALAGKVTTVSRAFEEDQRALKHMVDDHLDAMKQILMLPVSTLVEIFPRLVRDLARDQGKEVDLVTRGTELEIDKRILEELKDPLVHLVRNCVDHGIEKPEARARLQKPARGTVTLSFSSKDSRQVEILVSDDGVGIDVEQVRAAAIKAGVITAEAAEKSDPQETLALIFQSGVSTSEMITDISGRGLGLAIVREKAEKLGGVVSVDTHANVGTTFRLLLPLTLATFRGVLVRAREQVFVLPTAHVERALRVSRDQIQTVENRETIQLDGHVLALVRLADVLELPVRGDDESRQRSATLVAGTEHVPVLILASVEKRIAVQVDEVLAEQEVLVKGLGKQLSRVRNIAGATVLASGKVVPVLNVADLLKSAVRPGVAVGAPAADEKTLARAGRVLVAEDSITARTLLKNILETGGYQVTTAVDGADAFTQLRSGEFDLVVSDVDMPRMSGFELTTRLRGDPKLGELPVVLVTALESRQDRERGIEVGANAYIIKSSFDQSNLLEVIQRLL